MHCLNLGFALWVLGGAVVVADEVYSFWGGPDVDRPQRLYNAHSDFVQWARHRKIQPLASYMLDDVYVRWCVCSKVFCYHLFSGYLNLKPYLLNKCAMFSSMAIGNFPGWQFIYGTTYSNIHWSLILILGDDCQ